MLVDWKKQMKETCSYMEMRTVTELDKWGYYRMPGEFVLF